MTSVRRSRLGLDRCFFNGKHTCPLFKEWSPFGSVLRPLLAIWRFSNLCQSESFRTYKAADQTCRYRMDMKWLVSAVMILTSVWLFILRYRNTRELILRAKDHRKHDAPEIVGSDDHS